MARVSRSPAAPPLGSAHPLGAEAHGRGSSSSRSRCWCNVVGCCGHRPKRWNSELLGCPGWGQKVGTALGAMPVVEPTCSKSGHLGRKCLFFSPSQHHYFGFCSFLFFYFFKDTIFIPHVQVTACCRRPWLCWDGGEPTEGTGPSLSGKATSRALASVSQSCL